MSEKIPQFDFSKKEDREKFETSAPEVKEAVLTQAQREAEFVNGFLERGEAKTYEEAQGKAEQSILMGIEFSLSANHIDDAIKTKENFPISPEKLEQVALIGIKDCWEENEIDDAIKIKNNFPISPEKLEQVALIGIKFMLPECQFDNAIKIKENLPISPEKLEQATLEIIKMLLSECYLDEIHVLLETLLSKSRIDRAIEIKNNKDFPVSPEKLEQATLWGIKNLLSKGQIDDAIKIKNNKEFPVSLEELATPEIEQAVIEGIKILLSKGDLKVAIKIKNNKEFPISPEKLATSEIEEATLGGITGWLSDGFIDIAIDDIKNNEEFPISPEKLATPEIKQAMLEGLERYLKICDKECGLDNQTIKQSLSFANKNNLIDAFPELSTKAQNIIATLQTAKSIDSEKIEAFFNAFNRSLSLQIYVYQNSEANIVEIIKNKPFLLDALVNNETFAPKLLTAFDGFDKTSKKKITKLFQFQQEISQENPDIQKDSPEFRLAMQEKLKSYAKNPEIMAELQKQGIDTENWLTHSEQTEFVLSGEALEEISISQFIERPFNRIIGETVPEYIRIFQEEIEPYKDELGKIRMPDAKQDELREKLDKMKKAYTETEDQQKKAGIEKGIVNLEQALARQKDVSYADKLRGAIFGLENMMTIVKAKKEEIKQYEDEKKYQKVNELKKKLYIDYSTLAIRFQNLQTDFTEKMTQYFGGHGEAILQAIQTQTAEMLSHFATDHQDLKKVFENADFDEQIKKTKAVSLALWHRNPDIDLYLGNYSPCCISIEGGAGWDGSESAIADYLTDISIQVLNLTDKEKNIPIMSAWLYLGKNEFRETAIVIDNIESDASQTDLYPNEIWQKVREYVIDYAKKIGVKKISMGSDDSDIEPREKERTTDQGEYRKIGPANGNRADGYYLESEKENDNWLIWESGS
jgi:hypothetical protein